MSIQETTHMVNGAVHTAPVTQSTRRDWERAQRAATQKERIAPGVYRIQSSRHADVFYSVHVRHWRCNCPAARERTCWHRETCRDMEATYLRRLLQALRAEYGDPVFTYAAEQEMGV